MVQWADYGISKVHYDHEAERIISAAVVPGPSYTAGGQVQMSREDIVEALKAGKSFIIVTWDGHRWQKGSKVRLMNIDGEDYIRTYHTRVPIDTREGVVEY